MEQSTSAALGVAPYLYWAAFVIPVALIFVGAFGDKLVSKEPFQWRHFYLGVDLTISSLAAALINVLDNLKEKDIDRVTMVTTLLFVVGCMLIFVALLAVHQQWESPDKPRGRQILLLGIASNLVGGTLLAAFVYLKLKGYL